MDKSDGDLEIDPDQWVNDAAPVPRRVDDFTVYDEILALLGEGGWVQGRDVHGTKRSLTAAIDQVVGLVEKPGPKAAALARSSRVRNRLGTLAGTTNLVDWNDARGRSFEDLSTLLSMAAVAFPDD
jgi:hypothetical protein